MIDYTLFYLLITLCDIQPVTSSPMTVDFQRYQMTLSVEKAENICRYSATDWEPDQSISIEINKGVARVMASGEMDSEYKFSHPVKGSGNKYQFKDDAIFVSKIENGFVLKSEYSEGVDMVYRY
ncbi:MAG: hypothetical protein P8X74_09805 [Reinekea sp.]